jgi:hypothetical protein
MMAAMRVIGQAAAAVAASKQYGSFCNRMPEHGNHQPKDRNESPETGRWERRPKAKSCRIRQGSLWPIDVQDAVA